jgi:hypothetical protein
MVRPSPRRIRRSTNTSRTASNANETFWPLSALAPTTPKDIVARSILTFRRKRYAMAERAVIAHLEKLHDDGQI